MAIKIVLVKARFLALIVDAETGEIIAWKPVYSSVLRSGEYTRPEEIIEVLKVLSQTWKIPPFPPHAVVSMIEAMLRGPDAPKDMRTRFEYILDAYRRIVKAKR